MTTNEALKHLPEYINFYYSNHSQKRSHERGISLPNYIKKTDILGIHEVIMDRGKPQKMVIKIKQDRKVLYMALLTECWHVKTVWIRKN